MSRPHKRASAITGRQRSRQCEYVAMHFTCEQICVSTVFRKQATDRVLGRIRYGGWSAIHQFGGTLQLRPQDSLVSSIMRGFSPDHSTPALITAERKSRPTCKQPLEDFHSLAEL